MQALEEQLCDQIMIEITYKEHKRYEIFVLFCEVIP